MPVKDLGKQEDHDGDQIALNVGIVVRDVVFVDDISLF